MKTSWNRMSLIRFIRGIISFCLGVRRFFITFFGFRWLSGFAWIILWGFGLGGGVIFRTVSCRLSDDVSRCFGLSGLLAICRLGLIMLN